MKRLITSGCSFTTYTPSITWPVYLSEQFDETYNYGQTGAGNKFIFNSIIEADTRLKFTPDDLVIVAWSGFFRHDMLKKEFDGANMKTYWETKGDWEAWTSVDPPVSRLVYECLTKEFSKIEYIHMTHTYMLALCRYLKARNIPYLFTSLDDCRGIGCLYDNKYGELQELYDDKFLIPQGLLKFIERDNKLLALTLGKPWGLHPSNSLHYKIAKKIAEAIGFSLSSHDDLIELDRLTVSENQICYINDPFDKHPLNSSCLTDISESPFEGIGRTASKYHRGTLPIYKQILKDVCS